LLAVGAGFRSQRDGAVAEVARQLRAVERDRERADQDAAARDWVAQVTELMPRWKGRFEWRDAARIRLPSQERSCGVDVIQVDARAHGRRGNVSEG
jgi:hypothetical protein